MLGQNALGWCYTISILVNVLSSLVDGHVSNANPRVMEESLKEKKWKYG